MKVSTLFRVVTTALVLSTLSFAAGVAGDLSEGPTSGARVVLRIPPQLPADTARAAPIALLSTSAAQAFEIRRQVQAARFEPIAALEMPLYEQELIALPKLQLPFEPKHESIHAV